LNSGLGLSSLGNQKLLKYATKTMQNVLRPNVFRKKSAIMPIANAIKNKEGRLVCIGRIKGMRTNI
jgi:hypothetical protein